MGRSQTGSQRRLVLMAEEKKTLLFFLLSFWACREHLSQPEGVWSSVLVRRISILSWIWMKQLWMAQIHSIWGIELLHRMPRGCSLSLRTSFPPTLCATPYFRWATSNVCRCLSDWSPLFICSSLMWVSAVSFDQSPVEPPLNCQRVQKEPCLSRRQHPTVVCRVAIRFRQRWHQGW